jgi:hypothetical protein
MKDFELFMSRVLAPIEDSCGGRGCSTEGRDGPWNLQVVTKVIFEAVKSAEAELA